MVRMARINASLLRLSVISLVAIAPLAVRAQTLSLDLGPSGGTTERALQLIALITIHSIAPAILVMVT